MKFCYFLALFSNVLCRRLNFEYYIFDIAACRLLIELLVGIVEVLNLAVRNNDGRVLLISERNHYEINV